MNSSSFSSNAPGQLTSIAGGLAWVPAPLPPDLPMTEPMATALARAAAEVGTLNGISRLQDPDLLTIPYATIEAIRSSEIENIHTTISDLLFQMVMSTSLETDAVREVLNYVHALQHGVVRLNEIPLCLNLLREVHDVLLSHSRGAGASPGEFRRSQVHLGGTDVASAVYVPPPVPAMMQCLDSWERYMSGNEVQHPLIQCAYLHYQLEAIHPFYDGNGRLGRLFNILFLVEKNVLAQPNLYLSAYFQRHRSEYYDRLLAVSQQNDWNGWVLYFLDGIATVAHSATTDCERLLEMRGRLTDDMRRAKVRPSARELLAKLFVNPYTTAKQAAAQLSVTFRAAQMAIDDLVGLGVLHEVTGHKRNRAYLAREILNTIEGLGR